METLRRLGRALAKLFLALALLALLALGVYLSFANYPWFAAAVVLVTLVVIGELERRRRAEQQARQRERARTRLHDGRSLRL